MPAVFEFKKQELNTPDSFLGCLSRAVEEFNAQREKSKYDPLSTSKLHQTITNGFDFEDDQWFDLVFDIGHQQQLDNVVQKVVAASKVLQPGMPPMLPSIIELAMENAPHVKNIVARHVENAAEAKKVHAEHTVQTGFLAP
jgi:hypothetical protein